MTNPITPEQLASSGTEHGHQAALFCWANDNIDKYPQLKWMFAIPNGFFGSSGQKAKMKAEGLKNGVWDIFLPVVIIDYDDFRSAGLFIEMKVGKNNLSEEQKEWEYHLNNEGYKLAICWSWEQARDVIIKYLEN